MDSLLEKAEEEKQSREGGRRGRAVIKLVNWKEIKIWWKGHRDYRVWKGKGDINVLPYPMSTRVIISSYSTR